MGHDNHHNPAKQIYNLCVGDDVKAALDSITDSSIAKPYVVHLNAGVYNIGDQVLNVPAYVTIQTNGDVIFDYTGNTAQKALVLASGAKLIGLAVQNHLSSEFAIDIDAAGSYVLDDLTFINVSRCVQVDHASARPTIRRPVFLPVSSAMVAGISVINGTAAIYDVRTGGNAAITDLFWVSGAAAHAHLFGLFSEQANVVNGIRVSASAVVEANECIVKNATKGGFIESGGKLILRAGILNDNDYGMDITGSGSEFEGVNVTFLGNTVNYQAGAGTISRGFGMSDANYFLFSPDAVMQVHFLSTSAEAESLAILAELHVGHPTFPRGTSFGGGAHYVNGMLVYTYDDGLASFTDETVAAQSPTGSTFTMGLDVNDALYVGSMIPISASDFHQFYGIEFLSTVAAVLGSGAMVAEYWDGSSWTAFNTMTAQAEGKHYRQDGKKFTSAAGRYQMLFDPRIATDWAKNDPMTLGTSYHWVRFRITTATITTAPTFQQIRLHTDAAELNVDGYREMFGKARAYVGIPVFWNSFQDAGANMADQDLWRSTNAKSGLINNNFNSDSDNVGAVFPLPRWVDTSAPLVVEVVLVPSGSGTLQMIAWLNSSKDGDTISTTDPASTVGEVSHTVSKSVTAGQQVTYQFELDISDKGTEGDGIPAELLWLNIEADSRGTAGNTYGVSFLVKALQFRDGAHL